MGEMVTGLDGRVHTLLDRRDLIFLVEEYAGYEISKFLQGYIEEIEEEAETAADELKEAEEEWNNEQEDIREIYLSIRDEAESLMELLDADRLNRKALKEVVKTIFQTVNDEL